MRTSMSSLNLIGATPANRPKGWTDTCTGVHSGRWPTRPAAFDAAVRPGRWTGPGCVDPGWHRLQPDGRCHRPTPRSTMHASGRVVRPSQARATYAVARFTTARSIPWPALRYRFAVERVITVSCMRRKAGRKVLDRPAQDRPGSGSGACARARRATVVPGAAHQY